MPSRPKTAAPPAVANTDTRLIQRQLQQAARAASVGIIATDLAHEIGNPLFAIQGMSEVLLVNPDRHFSSERAKSHVQTVFESAQRASSLIHDMLAFMRYSNTPEELDVRAVIEGALTVVERGWGKGNAVKREFEKVPPMLGFSDRLQLLFVNLLLGAMAEMPAGSELSIRIWAENGFTKVKLLHTAVPLTNDDAERRAARVFETAVCERIVRFHEGQVTERAEGAERETVIVFPLNNLSSMRVGAR